MSQRVPIGLPLRMRLLAVVGVLLVAGAVAFVLGVQRDRPPGPLIYESSVAFEFALPAGEVISIGVPLPRNATSQPIVLRTLTVEGVHDLQIVGTAIHDPSLDSAGIGSAKGFPPVGSMLAPLDGFSYPPSSGPWAPEVIVGLSRLAQAQVGTFDHLTLDYDLGDERYRLAIPFSVTIRAPAEEAP